MPQTELLLPLTFDPVKDILGTGTAAEVFRVSLGSSDTCRFALKRFVSRAGRDDFVNERGILEALSAAPHPSIVYFLSAWTAPETSYMLFPLADSDLFHLIRETAPPLLTHEVAAGFLERLHGLCDAARYIHDSRVIPAKEGRPPTRRIGFHHDLKPANTLIFNQEDSGRSIWKMADFGSGAVKSHNLDVAEELYNRKPSAGNPVYSAPECVIQGKALEPSQGAVQRFEAARRVYSDDSPDKDATYWCQSSEDGSPYLNPAVAKKLDEVEERCREVGYLQPLVQLVREMLSVSPVTR